MKLPSGSRTFRQRRCWRANCMSGPDISAFGLGWRHKSPDRGSGGGRQPCESYCGAELLAYRDAGVLMSGSDISASVALVTVRRRRKAHKVAREGADKRVSSPLGNKTFPKSRCWLSNVGVRHQRICGPTATEKHVSICAQEEADVVLVNAPQWSRTFRKLRRSRKRAANIHSCQSYRVLTSMKFQSSGSCVISYPTSDIVRVNALGIIRFGIRSRQTVMYFFCSVGLELYFCSFGLDLYCTLWIVYSIAISS